MYIIGCAIDQYNPRRKYQRTKIIKVGGIGTAGNQPLDKGVVTIGNIIFMLVTVKRHQIISDFC